MLSAPSRSERKAMRCPSRDHTGARFLPEKVRRRSEVEPDSSYTQMFQSLSPSLISTAFCLPSGEILGCWYGRAGSGSGFFSPLRLAIDSDTGATAPVTPPGILTIDPLSEN